MTPGEPSTLCVGLCVVRVCVCWGGGGRAPPRGGDCYLSLPNTSHPSPVGKPAILSIALFPALAMCTTWNSRLSPSSLLLLGALVLFSLYPPGLPRPSLWCSLPDTVSAAFSSKVHQFRYV